MVLIKKYIHRNVHLSFIGPIMDGVRDKLVCNLGNYVVFTRKKSNEVAHKLIKFALTCVHLVKWIEVPLTLLRMPLCFEF